MQLSGLRLLAHNGFAGDSHEEIRLPHHLNVVQQDAQDRALADGLVPGQLLDNHMGNLKLVLGAFLQIENQHAARQFIAVECLPHPVV